MTTLSDLMSPEALEQAIADGYVTRRLHRDWDLAILNYTDKAQFEGRWDEVTRQCRGLIYRPIEGDKIIARPFDKFFNYGQPEAAEIAEHEWGYVMDKVDGSLGIVYLTPDGEFNVATRGSFHSEQAEWATKWLRENLDTVYGSYPEYRALDMYTDMFEIVYPENRIVLDYGDRAELVYLASREVAGGEVFRYTGIGGARAELLGQSLEDALRLHAQGERPNAEGLVFLTGDGRAVKLKQEDYLIKHRARFNLTPRRIWEAVTSNVTAEEFVSAIPDEFHEAVITEWDAIVSEGILHVGKVNAVAWSVPDGTRKEQALHITEHYPHLAGELFAVLDKNWDKLARLTAKACEPKGPEATRPLAS